MAGPVGQEEGIAGAQELLAAAGVQDGAAIDLGAHPVAEAAGQVGLDDAGDHINAGALGGEDEVDADGTSLLGDAPDAVFDLAAGHHHEVRQLIDDHQHVGQRLEQGGAVGPARIRRTVREVEGAPGGQDLGVEVLQVLDAEQGQAAVAVLHLGHDPLQHAPRFLHVRDHRGPEVRDVLVEAQLHHLGIHQDELHLAGQGPHEAAADHGVHAHALAAAGAAANEQVGHLVEVRDHGPAGDVLAQRQLQQARRIPEGRTVDDLAEGDDLALGVGHLDAHQVFPGDAIHAHRLGLQGQGQVLFHAQDAGQGDAGVGLELEDRDHRSGLHARDDPLDLELGQLLSNLLPDLLEQRHVGLGVLLGGIEEAAGWQGIPLGDGEAGHLRWEGGERTPGRGVGHGQGKLHDLPAEAVPTHQGLRHRGLRDGWRRSGGQHAGAEGARCSCGHGARGFRGLRVDDGSAGIEVEGVDEGQPVFRDRHGLSLAGLCRLALRLRQGPILGIQLPVALGQGQQAFGILGIEVRDLGGAAQEGPLHHGEEALQAVRRQGPDEDGRLSEPAGEEDADGAGDGGSQDQGAGDHRQRQQQRQTDGPEEAAQGRPEGAAQPTAPPQLQGAGLGKPRPDTVPEGSEGGPDAEGEHRPGHAPRPAAALPGPGLPQEVGGHEPAAEADEGLQQASQGGTHGAAEVLHRRHRRALGEGMGIQGMEAAEGEEEYQGGETQCCPDHPAADSLQRTSRVSWLQCSPAAGS